MNTPTDMDRDVCLATDRQRSEAKTVEPFGTETFFQKAKENSDLRRWLLDPERRDHLIWLYRKVENSDPPHDILSEMNTQGLLDMLPDGTQRLSRKGKLLAYNIEEYRIQVESGKMFSLLEKLNVFPGSVVLDVGCGGGQSLFGLVNSHPSLAVGMDRDLGHLEIAQSFASNFPLKNGSFAFQQGDGNALPFKDNSVDVLICRGVLHYLQIYQALQEMTRVLKPGGRIFIHAIGFGSCIRQIRNSDFSGAVFVLFGILNGIFYSLTRKQITIRYKNHPVRVAYLTIKSLRALEGLGIKIKSLESVPPKSPAGYYVVVGEKS